MPNDGAGSIYAVRMRLARLTATGAPLAGAGNMLVSDALIRFGIDPQYEEGEEKTVKNGQGVICQTAKAPDTLKRANVSLAVCTPDPLITEMVAGGTLLMAGAEVAGYAAPAANADPTPNGISVELWSAARLGSGAVATPAYRWWALPKVKFRIEAQTLEEEFMTPTFSGFAEENVNWGDGPNNDWTLASNRIWQWQRTATVPTAALDALATPAQPVAGAVTEPAGA